MPSTRTYFMWLSWCIAGYAATQNITIHPPATVPNNASQPVNHNFPSLAWEKSSFASFAGNSTHPNHFSEDLVSILQTKTGKAIILRIGGTSADQDHYNASQSVPVAYPKTNSDGHGLWDYSIGPSYYPTLQQFKSSKITWQLAMAYESGGMHASADAMTQTKLAVKNIGIDRLYSLELGNEPNLYHGQGVRPASYAPPTYAAEALQHEADVEGNITTLPSSGPLYQALAYSSGVNSSTWNESSAFSAGLNTNNRIKTVSFHYYSATAASDTITLQHTLMSHTAIASGLDRFRAPLTYLRTHSPSVEFVLGEVGSAISPHTKDTLQGVFGASLWQADMMLYSMTLGIDRVHTQSGLGMAFAPWNATDVRAPYYGIAMAADFVGNETGQAFRVVEVEAGSDEHVVAYAGFVGVALKRVAVLNLHLRNVTMEGDGLDRTVQVEVPDGVTSVRVGRLMAPGANTEDGISWNGVHWVKGEQGVVAQKVANGTEVVKVDGGVASVNVRGSEGVILQMEK